MAFGSAPAPLRFALASERTCTDTARPEHSRIVLGGRREERVIVEEECGSDDRVRVDSCTSTEGLKELRQRLVDVLVKRDLISAVPLLDVVRRFSRFLVPISTVSFLLRFRAVSLYGGLLKRQQGTDCAVFETPREVVHLVVWDLDIKGAVAGVIDPVHEVLIEARIRAPIRLEVMHVVCTNPRRGLFRMTKHVEVGLAKLDLRVELVVAETKEPFEPTSLNVSRVSTRRTRPTNRLPR
jgi:hypothetical protein